ncbi:MAG: hypothetical protein IJB67_01860 [Firmicutes bacterium]|nr:hypothetical protein [Bacillota bacterium]
MDHNFEGRRRVLDCVLQTNKRAKAELYKAIFTLAEYQGINLSMLEDEELAALAVCDFAEADKFQRFIVLLSEYEAAKTRIEICLQLLELLNEINELTRERIADGN